jgi:Zn-dependent oligopeptidase
LIAANQRCAAQNMPILVELIGKRREAAQLLGYKCWADYKTAANMAGSTQAVRQLIQPLVDKLKPGLKADMAILKKLKRTSDRIEDDLADEDVSVINPWDISFLESLLMEEEYQIDSEEIRQHFPLDFVIERILEM